jgi:hypothetical protein
LITEEMNERQPEVIYSVVTDLAKFLGQSTLWPFMTAM